jgi:hypothetical protein
VSDYVILNLESNLREKSSGLVTLVSTSYLFSLFSKLVVHIKFESDR